MTVPARAVRSGTFPDNATDLIEQVRADIAADDRVLRETRDRRDLVKRIGARHNGALRTFNSGSLAHGTVNKPVSDADCGLVLDRRTHPGLGPEGAGQGPEWIVAEVAARIAHGVRSDYPGARVTTTKRAILVEFGVPLTANEDPSVDLVVALTRRDGPGLLIPNLETGSWDPSDPERHTALLTASHGLRTLRARVVRLAKAAIRGVDHEAVLCSFNIEALALLHVTETAPLPEALRDFLRGASADIAVRLTPDPADVSQPIKLPDGITNEYASTRLQWLADKLEAAINARDDRQSCLRLLADVFPDQLGHERTDKQGLLDELRSGVPGPVAVGAFGAAAASVKPTRAYGHEAS